MFSAPDAFFVLLVGRPNGADSLDLGHDRATISMSLGLFLSLSFFDGTIPGVLREILPV
ncbi:hypothetical protein MES4922_340054 [Mesorhizobium ventifaucium]|uniref:Uncharacterized protein n=1 Tax=Mesorhizobium ventifaucium TaxID=666020 RepID=A0ABM9E4Q6_9HYPH|nr:hypothetical protein MES4922_340054 [Mesorhizobium ventifaucium]